ncbi:MAG: RNA chaperone Hfq [Pseudomonadota bacterium]
MVVSQLEEDYLKTIQEKRHVALVYLKNGLCLKGYLEIFNTTCLMLSCDGQSQLIWRDKLASIVDTKQRTIDARRRSRGMY